MGKTLIIMVFLLAFTFQVGATENYLKWLDNRIDQVVKDRLEEIDDFAANHVIGPHTKINASGVYTPSLACADGSDDFAFISTEVVYAGYITELGATAEIFDFTGDLTSFDTVEAGYQCVFLVEAVPGASVDTFTISQSVCTQTSLETSIIPKRTKGRIAVGIVNLKTYKQWVPGDNWDKTGVTTTVHNSYWQELAF